MLMPSGLSSKEREAYIKAQPDPTRKISATRRNRHVGLRNAKPKVETKKAKTSGSASSR